MLAFRSVVIPLTAGLMNLISIGAAFGVVSAVFEKGWGVGVVGLESEVAIVSFVPLMMFAILFGLSMDYEVFLMTHIKEAWERTHDNTQAVIDGVAHTGRVITSAALIMVSVFFAFVLNGDPTVKQFGVGMGVAVAVDATLVRCLLVPAVMTLLGRSNWWFPRWLDRHRAELLDRGRGVVPRARRGGRRRAAAGRALTAQTVSCWRPWTDQTSWKSSLWCWRAIGMPPVTKNSRIGVTPSNSVSEKSLRAAVGDVSACWNHAEAPSATGICPPRATRQGPAVRQSVRNVVPVMTRMPSMVSCIVWLAGSAAVAQSARSNASASAPAGPAGPVGPVGPVAPCGPGGPVGPVAGSARSSKSLRRRVPLATFADVTALVLSCLVPTLFFGSVAAAHETPPRARKSASVAVTFA